MVDLQEQGWAAPAVTVQRRWMESHRQTLSLCPAETSESRVFAQQGSVVPLSVNLLLLIPHLLTPQPKSLTATENTEPLHKNSPNKHQLTTAAQNKRHKSYLNQDQLKTDTKKNCRLAPSEVTIEVLT